jgi:hypothetical protein
MILKATLLCSAATKEQTIHWDVIRNMRGKALSNSDVMKRPVFLCLRLPHQEGMFCAFFGPVCGRRRLRGEGRDGIPQLWRHIDFQ